MTSPQLSDFWPTDALRLRTPRLSLTPITERDFAPVLAATLAGIHDPREMPFAQPWTDQPRDQLIRSSLLYWWSIRGTVADGNWTLEWVVRQDDEVVGVQSLRATDFAVTRTVGSGSYPTARTCSPDVPARRRRTSVTCVETPGRISRGWSRRRCRSSRADRWNSRC